MDWISFYKVLFEVPAKDVFEPSLSYFLDDFDSYFIGEINNNLQSDFKLNPKTFYLPTSIEDAIEFEDSSDEVIV